METQWFLKDFQIQSGIPDNGMYDTKTEISIHKALQGETEITPGKAIHLNMSDQTVTNPDDLLVLVTKTRNLPSNYEPDDLVLVNVPHVFHGDNLPNKKLQKVAANALEELFTAGKQEGMQLFARSGYRPYEMQVEIFARNIEKKGEEKANQYSARPGQSEHQTGLAMDVTCPEVENQLTASFAETKEGRWIKKYAADFGFIIRYLKGKEKITGYLYEPWHLRYVGKEPAQAITSQNLTLEKYLLVHL
ncbi:M15 family metallopeptidase [Bacillaceae bacterium Marseille-Q3522]|nr:M15 family metallopeptidase [Bacillaceae bacterium Marseille-Q3522]